MSKKKYPLDDIFSNELTYLHVNHHLIYAWGSARIYWHGPKKDLDKLFAWIKKNVPKKKYDIDAPMQGAAMTKHWETSRNILFHDFETWWKVCNHWSETGMPDLYFPWKLNNDPAPF